MSVASVSTFPGHPFDQNAEDAIMIFLAVDGSVIPMRVLASDSIAALKLRVQNHKGFYVKKQKLVFEGKELARNTSSVKDYGVGDGNLLHLVIRLSDLQAITVRTVCGKEFELHVGKERNVGFVKQQIAEKGKGLDLEDQELLLSNGEELEDQRLIGDICKSNEAVVHLLARRSVKFITRPIDMDLELSFDKDEESSIEKDLALEPVVGNPDLLLSAVRTKLVNETCNGLEKGNEPVRSSEGAGGAYLMQDASGQRYVSVFKPIDEEPMAMNNPRGLPLSLDGEGLKKGTRAGEGAVREVAAYVLDYPSGGHHSIRGDRVGFAGVPPTFMVRCRHKEFNYSEGCDLNSMKIGSLQMFMENCGSCEEMGPGLYPVDEVHKISVLDIRLANTDRHAGNILVHKNSETGQVRLIPIDHGYCLPDNFADCSFDWLYWRQAREPYTAETAAYIRSLDADKDIQLLKSYGWEIPSKCAEVLRISTMLLKKGAERGLSPFAIGSIMCRETLNKASTIEQIVREGREAVLPGAGDAAFLETVSVLIDGHFDSLSQK